MHKRLAVYAGTFDPPTNGHLWMIQRGAASFQRLVVAIGINPEKKCLFSIEDRLRMLRECVKQFPNVKVTTFPYKLLVRYAQSLGAQIILRGIRTESDFEYERGMRNVNGDIDQSITTFFLMPPREMVEVSSSLVKGLVGLENWKDDLKRYVPAVVLKKLKEVVHAKSQ